MSGSYRAPRLGGIHRMKGTKEELLNLGMGRLFVKLAVPGILGTLIIGLYNLMDSIFVGQFVGKDGVGAIAIVYSIVLLNQAISTLIGVGSMSLLSRAIGEDNEPVIRRILGNLVLFSLIPSAMLSAVSYLFARPIVAFFGGKGEILELGVEYLEIMAMGFVLSSVGPAMNMLLRGEGRMKQAMIVAATGMILNIILDPIFIYYFGWGIAGAAIATVLSQGVYLIANIAYYLTGKSIIKIRIKEFKFAFDLMPQILSVGLAGVVGLIMIGMQQVILFRSLSTYGGNDHVALMGASFRVFLFAFIPLTGIGQGLQPILGMNFGAKRYDRVKKAFTSFTLIASGISFFLWVCFMLFPGTIISWFITSQRLVSVGRNHFRWFFAVFFVAGFIITTGIMFQALGKGAHAAALAAARQIVCFLPLVFVLPKIMGVTGTWISLPIADVMTFVLAGLLLLNEFRRHAGIFRRIGEREAVSSASPAEAPAVQGKS
jgi:putative MATE family efflux protein